MLPSFVVAALISLWLAGSVTNPLHAATEVARHVVAHRDFTRRAPRQSDDEVGTFVDAFNTMVAEVGQRTAQLQASHQALEQETEERRLAVIALRRSDQRKDEFLATLAHELRNPLAPMVNSLDLLESGPLAPAVAKQAHEIMRRQLRHLVRLVDDLLDVSRVTSGKLVMRKQVTDLAQIVQSAVDTVQPLLDARQQTLSVELPTEPVHLEADNVRLAQVLTNLLNNASKFSAAQKKISLLAAVTSDGVDITITDEGVGIAPEMVPRLFQMFVQGDTPHGMPSGLGVGLSLARRLVELHGGTIVAASDGLGHGSAFTVKLPRASQPIASTNTIPMGNEGMGPARRILVADDNVDFATTLSFLLQSLGHEVRIAHSGNEALEIASQFRPELGFLDLGLPDIDGYQLAGALRSQAETATTVLVAISGWGQQRDKERSKDAGFAMHLVKPADFDNILAAITTLLPRD